MSNSKKNGQTATFGYDTLLGRGYTGHEHFASVGLVHMNGRMYDANLGRFLSPDNFIQDPYNTQSFNRYGYVWNNPLKFNDPSGEFFVVAMIIGAVIGAYIGGASANGGNFNPFQWDWSSGATWAGIGIGAVVGAIGGEVIAAGIAGLPAFGIFGVKLGVGIAIPGLGTFGIVKSGEKLQSEYTNPQGETFNQEIGTIPTFGGGGENNPPDKSQGAVVDADDVINQQPRPDLGFVGNRIRNQAGSEFSKNLFENYWLAKGDIELTNSRFQSILNAKGSVAGSKKITLSNGQPGIQKVHTFYNSNEYSLALGRATIFYDQSGIPVGFIDIYDFDAKPWGVRSISNEHKTRAVHTAGNIFGAQGYKIKYGLQSK